MAGGGCGVHLLSLMPCLNARKKEKMMIKVQEERDVGVKFWRRQEGMGSSLQWGGWTGLMDCLPRKGRGHC